MAKTAKKPTAKKTKSKTAAAKTTAKATVASPAKRNTYGIVTLEKLYKFNIFSAALNLVFAILSILFVSQNTVDLSLSYAVKDELASAGSTVLGPAFRTLATVEIRYLLAGIFLLSALFSLLLATKLRKTYEAGVSSANSGIRWLFMGITLGLTLELLTLLAGIGDIFTLKLVGGLVVIASLTAWLNERANKDSKKHYIAFALSVFAGLVAWAPFAGSIFGTSVYGVTNFDWYVYILGLVVLLGFISITLALYGHTKNGVTRKGYLQLEGRYLTTDFLIKLAVFVAVLLDLHK